MELTRLVQSFIVIQQNCVETLKQSHIMRRNSAKRKIFALHQTKISASAKGEIKFSPRHNSYKNHLLQK